MGGSEHLREMYSNPAFPLRGEIYVKISKNRTARKQQQIEENQFFEDSEGLLYGPGVAD